MSLVKYCLGTKGSFEALTCGTAIVVGAYLGWKMGEEAGLFADHLSESLSTIDYVIRENPLAIKATGAIVGATLLGFVGKFPGRVLDYLYINSKRLSGQ